MHISCSNASIIIEFGKDLYFMLISYLFQLLQKKFLNVRYHC